MTEAMSRTRFWFTSLPGSVRSRVDPQFDFQCLVLDDVGWAVLTHVPMESFDAQFDWEREFIEFRSTPGALAMIISLPLDEESVGLPSGLRVTMDGSQPAEAFGYGQPGLIKIDDQYIYGGRWEFDQYQVIVTVSHGLWLCVIAGSLDLIELSTLA